MLSLTQVRCAGSAASAFCGSRDGFVARPRGGQRPVSTLQVRATTSEQRGAGWLESVVSTIGQVGSYVDKKLHSQSKDVVPGGDMVTYKGTATIMKKLKVLDLMDRVADMQDDASEVFGGKHVSVQLVSNEIDPSMIVAICQQICFSLSSLLLFGDSLEPVLGSCLTVCGWIDGCRQAQEWGT